MFWREQDGQEQGERYASRIPRDKIVPQEYLSHQETRQLPGNQVQVEMGNGLSAMHTGVDHQAVAVFRNIVLHGQFLRHHNHVSHQGLIRHLQIID
jgi:hypothetical protein